MIWAADGTVLAQSRQLGIIMPTENPVLKPELLRAEAARSKVAGAQAAPAAAGAEAASTDS